MQLQGRCLTLEDTRLATGASLLPRELSRRLDALSSRSGSGQQLSVVQNQQIGDTPRQISEAMQMPPAFSLPSASTSQGPARHPKAGNKSQADWSMTGVLHQHNGNPSQISAAMHMPPASSPIPVALMSQGSAQIPAAGNESQAYRSTPGVMRHPEASRRFQSQADCNTTGVLHQPEASRWFQSQAALPPGNMAASDASLLQQLQMSQPPSRSQQGCAAYPVSTPSPHQAQVPTEAADAQGLGTSLTTLGLMGPQGHHLWAMPGSGANIPTSRSRPGGDDAAPQALSAALQQASVHSWRPTAAVSTTCQANLSMDLSALPAEPSVPARASSQGFSYGESAADVPHPGFADPLRQGLDGRAAPSGPALHHAQLHGMGHMPLSTQSEGTHNVSHLAQCMSGSDLHSSLLTLPEVAVPSMRAPRGTGLQRTFQEDSGRAEDSFEPLPSLAELCLPPRGSSSATTSLDEDTMWVPELPPLPPHRRNPQDRPMDLADLL